MADIDGKGITLLLAGCLFAFSGVKGKSIANTARAFITGNDPASTVSTFPISAASAPLEDYASATTPGRSARDGQHLAGSAAGNRSLGRMLAAQRGWTGAEWTALDQLWTRESSWSNYADNPSSHAYGIPQALPATKLPHAGRPASLGGASSAVSQIAWGLNYIHERYGSPSVAWQHEVTNGWY